MMCDFDWINYYEVTAVLRDFSTSDNNGEWEVSDNFPEQERAFLGIHGARIVFYANGNCKENKGYVSIICTGMFRDAQTQTHHREEYEVRYFFSVMDISGNKRFTQSIVQLLGNKAPRDSEKLSRGNFDFGLERYLKREILLNDPAELLPGDCLTIFVEMHYKCLSSNLDGPEDYLKVASELLDYRNQDFYHDHLIKHCQEFLDDYCFSVDTHYGLCIPLDTFYGKELCSFSGFFRRASDTILTEGTDRKVHIPNIELDAFTKIFSILFNPTFELVVKSIEDICQLYVIADKYDFQSVIEACRHLIKAFLRTTGDSRVREHAAQSVSDIIKLTNQYRDKDLKDTVNTYLESKESFGTNNYALGKYLKEEIVSEWECASTDFKYFKCSRIAKPEFEYL